MKKIIFVMALFIVSCSKSDDNSSINNKSTFCWECLVTNTTTVSVSTPGYPQTVKSKTDHCNLTEDQIQDMIKLANTTQTYSAGGIKATSVTKMTCSKK